MPYPNIQHGFTGTVEHKVWRALIQRATDPEHTSYYCTNGIDERWLKFTNFLEDMGPASPDKKTVIRLDWRLPYGPENCRWGDRKEARSLRRPDRERSHYRESEEKIDLGVA